VKKPAGYQAALACLTPWVNGEAPSALTCLSLGPPAFGLLAYGNGSGLVIVDHLQQKGEWLLFALVNLYFNFEGNFIEFFK